MKNTTLQRVQCLLVGLLLLLAGPAAYAQTPAFCTSSVPGPALSSFTTSFQTVNVAAGSAYYWAFTGTAGVTYSFSNCGGNEDTYLRIYNLAGTVVIANDDNGIYCSGTRASLDFACTSTGTYYLHLSQYSCTSLSLSEPLAYKASSGSGTPAPAISSFSPTSGPAGTNVTITGTNFSGATGVRFNGTTATYTVNSATSISATVPAGATSGTISVTTPGGTATSAGSFTVTVLAPTLTSISPSTGGAGTTVTLTGSNLTGATGVRFGSGGLSLGFTVVNATTITALVPLDAASGPVAVTTPGGTATSAGSFTYVPGSSAQVSLSPTGPLSACSPQTLTASAVLPGFNPGNNAFNDPLWTVVVQPDGKILAGGFFTNFNGTGRRYLLRLNADGSLDNTFNPSGAGIDNTVYSLLVQPDGKILVGGAFSGGLLRLNANGSLDNTFANASFNSAVWAMAQQADGKVVVGGSFSTYNGSSTRAGLSRLNPNGSLDASFNSGGFGLNGAALTVALQADGKIVAGGDFSTYNGTTVPINLLRVNANGSLDASFNPSPAGFNNRVWTVAVQPDGKVLAGGAFQGNSSAPGRLVRLNPSGTVDNTFNYSSFGFANDGFDNAVWRIALQADGKVVVGGSFSLYNSAAVPNGLLRLNANGSRDTSFNNGGTGFPSSTIYGVALQPDGQVLAGGIFVSYNGNAAAPDYLARLTASGALNLNSAAASGGSYTFSPGGSTTNPLTTSTPGSYTATFTQNGATSAPSNTVVVNACSAPAISSFTPSSGPVGTSVTITGSSFNGATAVAFNGTAATSFTVNSATQITVSVPSGATTGPIAVTTPSGTGTSAASFTVPSAGTPTFCGPSVAGPGSPLSFTTSFQTVSVAAGNRYHWAFTGTAGVTYSFSNCGGNDDTYLRIYNAAGTEVDSNDDFGPYCSNNSASLDFVCPATGTYYVHLSQFVCNTLPSASPLAYRINNGSSAPVISAFSPGSGPVASTVVISGSGFTGATIVRFNGTSASFSVDANNQITAVVPNGATSGAISVTTPGGTATSTTSFTVQPNPVVYSFSPTSGPVGTSVVITGDHFIGVQAVYFGGGSPVPASYVVNSATQITATVPAGAGSGVIGVNTGGFSSFSSTPFTVTTAAPSISSFTPTSGGAGTSVTVTGTNFTGASSVTVNGVAVTGFTVVNNTTITFSLPAGTGSGPIAVTTANGTATSTGIFTAPVGDLTVSSAQTISGTYNTITITASGVATLGGPLTVNTALTVQPGGQLLTSCQPLSGAGSFTLQAGATLGICNAAGLSASGSTGAVQTSGARSFSTDASYLYNGTVAQATGPGLPAQVRELIVSTTGGNLTLTNDLAIAQVLRITTPDFNYGNLDLGGRTLTLRSSAAGTALIHNAGNGSVLANTGTCRMERYITPGLNPGAGYRHFSSPIPDMTIGQLATTGFTPVLTQAYNTSATPASVTPFPNVFGYDQTRLSTSPAAMLSDFDKGWFVPAATTAMAQAHGYTVNVPATALVTFSGSSFNQGQGGRFVSPGRGPQADAGWVLVGNPFPSPIDLSVTGSQLRINLDAANYVFESTSQYGGQYRAYVNGIGGNSLLAAGQGFFVRMTTPGQNSGISFTSGVRVTTFATQATFRRTAADSRPQLQLSLSAAANTDVLHVYAEAGATPGVDAQYDAVKMANPSGLNLATVAGGEELAIQGLPALTSGTTLPLTVQVPAAGLVSFAATLANLPAGLTAYLTDAATGTRQDLGTTPRYSFLAAQAGTLSGRFALVFGPANGVLGTASAQAAALALYPNPARTAVTLSLPATAQARPVLVLDALGRQVGASLLPSKATSTLLDLRELPAGIYTVRCGAATTKLVVE
ncbi:IPT/TIG domain-containing protein [Hymenobacter saemangeumensis]